MRAALLTCVHDYPANGNTSCQVTHGYKACTKCGENTSSEKLSDSSKIVYMGHRKWLDAKDPWRDDKERFNGKTEHGTVPKEKSGMQILEIVNDLEVVPGKIGAKKYMEPEGIVWRRRSVFWDLEYWAHLECRHSIYVMHVEKNVCDNVLGLLMNITEKTKDGPNEGPGTHVYQKRVVGERSSVGTRQEWFRDGDHAVSSCMLQFVQRRVA